MSRDRHVSPRIVRIAASPLVLCLAWLLLANRAAAQPALLDCLSGSPETRIEKCTLFINQTDSEKDRALALVFRGRLHEAAGGWDQAIDDYTAALRINPEQPDVFFTRGRAHAAKGDLRAAIEDYSAAIKGDPEEVEYRLLRADACRKSGELSASIVDLSAAIRLEPKSASALLRRGEAFFARRERPRGIADLDAASAIEPNSVTIVHARGELYRKAGEYDRAIADFDQAIKLDPKFGGAYLHRAEARIGKKDFEGALADLSTAIELDPNNPTAHNVRGFIYASKGDYERALAEHTIAIIIDPLTAYRYSARAWTYRNAGQLEPALFDADYAVRYAPEAPSVYVVRGLIREQIGFRDAAIADFNKALSIAPIEEGREALRRLGAPLPESPKIPPRTTPKPARLDETSWLESKLKSGTQTGAVYARDETAKVRSGPAGTLGVVGTARREEGLTVTSSVEYKVKTGCGVDGASAEAPWLKVRPSGSPEGYVKSTEVITEEQKTLISQMKQLEKIVANYYDDNRGSLKDFAGIYDGLKECKTEPEESELKDPIMLSVMFTTMAIKQVIWFQGDTMVSVKFLTPQRKLRGKLSFWRDFDVSEGGKMKLYTIKYDNGSSEKIGFYQDLLMIDPKISGNSITYNYAKRCSNEVGMVEWARAVYGARAGLSLD